MMFEPGLDLRECFNHGECAELCVRVPVVLRFVY